MKGSPAIAVPLVLLALAAGVSPLDARRSPYRIGVLFWHESPNDRLALSGVKDGFEILGLEPVFDVRNVAKDPDRAREVLEAWEEGGFDLIYAMGTSAALRAKETTRRIPVVFTAVTNPVGRVVPNWEGSGTNLCGNSNWISTPDVLDVFRQAVPGLARLGVVYNQRNPVSLEEVVEAKRFFRENESKRLGLIEEWIDGPDDLEDAVAAVLERGAQALWIPIDDDVYKHLDRVARLTMPKKVPLLSSQQSAVQSHAVVGVAVDYRALGERSVVIAEKVLRRGAKPGSLPIGRMGHFQVYVNLQSARRCGLRVPLPFLATADVILDPAREVR